LFSCFLQIFRYLKDFKIGNYNFSLKSLKFNVRTKHFRQIEGIFCLLLLGIVSKLKLYWLFFSLWCGVHKIQINYETWLSWWFLLRFFLVFLLLSLLFCSQSLSLLFCGRFFGFLFFESLFQLIIFLKIKHLWFLFLILLLFLLNWFLIDSHRVNLLLFTDILVFYLNLADFIYCFFNIIIFTIFFFVLFLFLWVLNDFHLLIVLIFKIFLPLLFDLNFRNFLHKFLGVVFFNR